MTGVYLVLPTLLVVILSFLVIRAGAVALMMTGMDYKKASFQALSAFTRAGFTTRESETVVNNPQRRRIITWLIIIGNAGFISLIVTATSSVATSDGYILAISIFAIVIGIYLVYRLIHFPAISRRWERFVENRLIKSPIFEEGLTEDLLHLAEGYGVVRLNIAGESPFIGRTIRQTFSPEEHLWVVGIERGKDWVSIPRQTEVIENGDQLVIYGNLDTLKKTVKQAGDSR